MTDFLFKKVGLAVFRIDMVSHKRCQLLDFKSIFLESMPPRIFRPVGSLDTDVEKD